jgi:hypothetical protein
VTGFRRAKCDQSRGAFARLLFSLHVKDCECFQVFALDERTVKYCEKTSESQRNALDIFFRRRITRATVRVEIYRLAGSGEGWSLEVVDQDGTSTVWKDLFANDQDAYAEVSQTLETEGIRSFAGSPPAWSH